MEERLHPGVLMFIAGRHVETRVMQALAAAGYDDITLAQARVMARVGPDGTRLTSLAEQAQVTKQAAGELVDQLARAGYVERVPDPSDARAKLIRFGPRAAGALEQARRVEVAVREEWLAHLGPARMEALQEALESLREITDPFAEG